MFWKFLKSFRKKNFKSKTRIKINDKKSNVSHYKYKEKLAVAL